MTIKMQTEVKVFEVTDERGTHYEARLYVGQVTSDRTGTTHALAEVVAFGETPDWAFEESKTLAYAQIKAKDLAVDVRDRALGAVTTARRPGES